MIKKCYRKLKNISVEWKNSTAGTTVTPGTTSTLTHFNGLSQGNSSTTRVGDKVKFKRLFIRGEVVINSAGSAVVVRLMVVRDRQPNGAIFGITDLLVADSTIDLNNLKYGKRFKVYMDKKIPLSINGNRVAQFKKYIPLNFETDYSLGTAGTVADISKNSLYFILMSTDNTNKPTVTYNRRLRFIDS